MVSPFDYHVLPIVWPLVLLALVHIAGNRMDLVGVSANLQSAVFAMGTV